MTSHCSQVPIPFLAIQLKVPSRSGELVEGRPLNLTCSVMTYISKEELNSDRIKIKYKSSVGDIVDTNLNESADCTCLKSNHSFSCSCVVKTYTNQSDSGQYSCEVTIGVTTLSSDEENLKVKPAADYRKIIIGACAGGGGLALLLLVLLIILVIYVRRPRPPVPAHPQLGVPVEEVNPPIRGYHASQGLWMSTVIRSTCNPICIFFNIIMIQCNRIIRCTEPKGNCRLKSLEYVYFIIYIVT